MNMRVICGGPASPTNVSMAWRDGETAPISRNPRKLRLNGLSPLTHVDITHAPDAAYEPLKRHYDEKQIANLTYAIALMNAWNRVGIGFQLPPQPRSGHHSA